MSKFCGNCGAQMEDNARVCGYCGVAFENAAKENFKYKNPQKKEKTRKTVKNIITAVLAVVILSIVVSIGSSLSGYRGTVRKFMKAYKAENAEAIADMSCSLVKQYVDDDEIIRTYENALSSDFDSFDSYFDSKYKIKYEVESAEKLSARKMNEFRTSLLESGEVPEDDVYSIKKMMSVKLNITAKRGSDSKTVSRTLYLIKEGLKWKLCMIAE